MNPVAATRYAAHVEFGGPRTRRLVRHTRQIFDVVVDVLDAQLLELLRAQRRNAEWDVLQTLGTLLRRNDDFLESTARRCVLSSSRVQAGDDRRRERQ